MDKARERKATLSPLLVPYLEALLLFALYAVGYPWFAVWCNLRLPDVKGRWVIEEAASLVVVTILIALLNHGKLRAVFRPSVGMGWFAGSPIAFRALFILGLLALSCRLLDPAFDEREFMQRGLTSPGILVELLAMLPFGVVAEELVFRTCQARLRSALHPAAAILAVSLAFALYHRVPGTPLDRHEIETLLATFAGGLVLSITYEKTRSLPLLILVHLSYDFLAVIQGWLNVQHQRLAEACLFLLWIGFSSLLAWGPARAFHHRPESLGSAGAEIGSQALPSSGAISWMAAMFFGAAVPLLLAWTRVRLGI
jgi:membrane protease YdiL (CAAX protease family)